MFPVCLCPSPLRCLRLTFSRRQCQRMPSIENDVKQKDRSAWMRINMRPKHTEKHVTQADKPERRVPLERAVFASSATTRQSPMARHESKPLLQPFPLPTITSPTTKPTRCSRALALMLSHRNPQNRIPPSSWPSRGRVRRQWRSTRLGAILLTAADGEDGAVHVDFSRGVDHIFPANGLRNHVTQGCPTDWTNAGPQHPLKTRAHGPSRQTVSCGSVGVLPIKRIFSAWVGKLANDAVKRCFVVGAARLRLAKAAPDVYKLRRVCMMQWMPAGDLGADEVAPILRSATPLVRTICSAPQIATICRAIEGAKLRFLCC